MNEPTERQQAHADFMEAVVTLDLSIKAGLSNLDRAINGHAQPLGRLRCRLFGHRWEGRIYPYCPRCNEIHYS